MALLLTAGISYLCGRFDRKRRTNHASPVLAAVADERKRQDQKWGVQNHPSFVQVPEYSTRQDKALWLSTFYGIRCPTSARKVCDSADLDGKLTYMHILVEEVAELTEAATPKARQEELIQVAAVAVAWAESIERNEL